MKKIIFIVKYICKMAYDFHGLSVNYVGDGTWASIPTKEKAYYPTAFVKFIYYSACDSIRFAKNLQ